MVIALLAGGTGGAKLAAGLRDLLERRGAGELRVIANTGDDIEIYGVHVSPDPDLISFRLAGVLDERGFGIAGESHGEMDRRRSAGEDIWFELGDEDLAVCRSRAAALAAGSKLTEAHRSATASYDTGVATVLPMSDQPVRTIVETTAGDRPLQEFLIRDRGAGEITGVRFDGIDAALPTLDVLDAISSADAVVIGPSNPVISIQPILELGGLRDALAAAAAPVVAVSPFVEGEVLKGPTAAFMTALGYSAGNAGAMDFYAGLIDGFVADSAPDGGTVHVTDVRMADSAGQLRLAEAVADFAAELSGRRLVR
ncbi:MAG: 2-phospho-L-lactate transferase CofD family protein [Solirubrobacterales bacterium]